MLTFKEYSEKRNYQERIFTFGSAWRREYPIYLSPSAGDLETLGRATRQIRGLTKGEFVFVWDAEQAGHQTTSDVLERFDPDLKQYPTDICFYLNRKTSSPLRFELKYSSWTGESTNSASKNIHLRRLLEFPGMSAAKSFISNIENITDSNPNNHDYDKSDRSFSIDVNPQPMKPPSSIAAWQQAGSINPYIWKNGVPRVGD